MKTLLRRIAYAAVALVVLLAITAGSVYGVSTARIRATVPVPRETVVVAATPEVVARGRHVVTALAKCGVCHGEDLGGSVFVDDPLLGRIVAPNLTRGDGGVGDRLTPEAIELALRHGIRPDGRSLLVMPSEDYVEMSDEDVAAVAAYLRQLPPVDRVLPAIRVGPLGHALHVFADLPLLSRNGVDTTFHHVASAPPASAPVEYGRYLANVGGCTGCHGPTLSGGPIPGEPPGFKPAANLTPEGIGTWTEADFFRALREGIRPSGTPIDPSMPVKYTKLMTDDEIRAVYAYLRTVPGKAYGGR